MSRLPRLTLVQEAGRLIINGGEGLTAAIFFSHLFFSGLSGSLSQPYASMLEMSGVYLNYKVGGILHHLSSKEDVYADLVNEGGGDLGVGLGKATLRSLLPVGILATGGYGLNELITKYTLDLSQSNDVSAQIFGDILNTPDYRGPLLGTIGLGCAIGLEMVFRKIFNCCGPNPEEELNDHPNLNKLQKFTDYVVLSTFGDITLTETMLSYLNLAGQTAISSNPDVQIALLYAAFAYRTPHKHCSHKLEPIDCLVEKEKYPTLQDVVSDDTNPHYEPSDDENPLLNVPSAPISDYQRYKAVAKSLAIGASMLTIGYCFKEFTCAFGALSEDTLDHRMARYTVSLVLPKLLRFGVEAFAPQVVEKVIPKITKCWAGFLNRSKEQPAAPIVTNTNDYLPTLNK